jgi:hypothetical protein
MACGCFQAQEPECSSPAKSDLGLAIADSPAVPVASASLDGIEFVLIDEVQAGSALAEYYFFKGKAVSPAATQIICAALCVDFFSRP